MRMLRANMGDEPVRHRRLLVEQLRHSLSPVRMMTLNVIAVALPMRRAWPAHP